MSFLKKLLILAAALSFRSCFCYIIAIAKKRIFWAEGKEVRPEGQKGVHMKKIIAAAAAAAMLTLSACGSSGETIAMVPAPTDSAVNTITVNSNEKVNVVPDIAEVVYSVQTESPDAAGCQQQNTEDVNKVVELLTGLGVEEGSIQTTGYYMNPRYSWSNDTQTLIGYEATTTLTVSDLLIDSLGDILTQSVNAGVNNIQSISYLSSNYDESYQEALRLSIEAAKAEAMAQAAGCQLGGITQLREQSSYSPARYTDNALAEKTSLSAARDTGSVTIMPGELEVEAVITVEYQLLPNS